MPYAVPFSYFFGLTHVKTSLSRGGTSDLLGGHQRCFEGFFHLEIASESNFDLASHFSLGAQLAATRGLLTSLT